MNANLAQEDLDILGYDEWLDALERGIAAHHAGLLPSFKETVEDLFKRGLVKAVFATETLALGINMPAKTVILEKLTKWNGEAHVPITPGSTPSSPVVLVVVESISREMRLCSGRQRLIAQWLQVWHQLVLIHSDLHLLRRTTWRSI